MKYEERNIGIIGLKKLLNSWHRWLRLGAFSERNYDLTREMKFDECTGRDGNRISRELNVVEFECTPVGIWTVHK
jgi:hypothetical protein